MRLPALNLRLAYDRRAWATLAIFALVISIPVTTGWAYLQQTATGYWPGAAQTAGVGIVLLCAAGTVCYGCDLLLERIENRRPGRIADVLCPTWNKKSIILHTLLVLTLWLPWRLVTLPGLVDLDAFYMTSMFYDWAHPIATLYGDNIEMSYTDAIFSDHHPIFDTLIYGLFCVPSDVLTGSWNAGVTVYTTLQAAILAFEFTASIAYMHHLGANRIVCAITLALVAILPSFAQNAFYMTKDLTAMLAAVPFATFSIATVLTKGDWIRERHHTLLVVTCALWFSLAKKTGVFIVVIVAVICIISCRKSRRGAWKTYAGAALTSVLATALFLPYIAFPALSVEPGGRQEALSLPLQQAAMYAADYPEDMTEAQRDATERLIDIDAAARDIELLCHDKAKSHANPNMAMADVVVWLPTYASWGLRHPDAYLKGTMSATSGYFAPQLAASYTMTRTTWPKGAMQTRFERAESNPDARHMTEHIDVIPGLYEAMEAYIAFLQKTPGLQILNSVAAQVWWAPMALLFVCIRKRRPVTPAFVLWAAPMLFCIVGPACLLRYAVSPIWAAVLLAPAATIQEKDPS